ncbi:unnamed protein product [Caenorhabditis auriculariae]|uniref:COP9/Signalosome and eIF3 complex-shared subunit 1 n=1 Tax=Caenorhabditis auriculariae TaxID=2777116 RepID=A0A8S1HVK8_9PELO|nr:unnamed protein product [Caenorhabditis auriculariae]
MLSKCRRFSSILRSFHSFPNYISDLHSRGLLENSYPTDIRNQFTEELKSLPPFAYAGFDPTAESLHIGNLIILVNLLRCSEHRIQPIVLIGGATSKIGDPSGKDEERVLIDADYVVNNSRKITEKCETICGRSPGKLKPIIVNNDEWIGKLTMKEYRKHCESNSFGKMLRMRAIKSRLNDDISFTEFSYQNLQAYDWFYLSQKYGCRFQIGGSDQLGHLDFGAHYIKKRSNEFAAGVCLPLLTDSNGKKLGKSEGGGALWLDSKMTEPSRFHQFFSELSNEDARKLLLKLSLRPLDDLRKTLEENEQEKGVQKLLADELTSLVHGSDWEIVKSVQNIASSKKNPVRSEKSTSKSSTDRKTVPFARYLDDLQRRGLIDHSPNESEFPPFVYAGFPSSSNSLSVSDLSLIVNILRCLKFGLRPIFLVEDGTYAEGSNTSSDNILRQLKSICDRFLSSEQSVEPPIILNNDSWYSEMSTVDYLRNCKQMKLKNILEMYSEVDSVSYGKCSDDTVNAYDWFMVAKEFGCGIVLPPFKDGNSIWLNAKLTSPYHFYQYFAQLPDSEAENLVLKLSLQDTEKIETVLKEHRENLGKWIIQSFLAKEMTKFVHGQEGLEMALRCTKALFSAKRPDLSHLSRDEILQVFGDCTEIRRNEIGTMGQLADRTRKDKVRGSVLMKRGAFSVNSVKVTDPEETFDVSQVVLPNADDLTLVCWGKRKYQLKTLPFTVSVLIPRSNCGSFMSGGVKKAHSKLQLLVLSTYREFLHAAKGRDPSVREHIRDGFRKSANKFETSNVLQIEVKSPAPRRSGPLARMADTRELPVFAFISEWQQLKEIREFLNKSGKVNLSAEGPEEIADNLIEICKQLAFLGTWPASGEVELILNSICSLIVVVPGDRCNAVVSEFTNSVSPKNFKGIGWASNAGHAVRVLSNLFRGYPNYPDIQQMIYKSLVGMCAESRLIGELDCNIEHLNQQFSQWNMPVEGQRELLRMVHHALLIDERADQAAKVMVVLLGTYTDADAATAREDATECVRTAVVDPKSFSFDHLQRLSAVQALQKSDSLMYSALELFISGTLKDYQAFVKKNPNFVKESLRVDETILLKKIRLLTLMSVAETKNEISLDELAGHLDLPADETLEEFIIDAIQVNAISGKINEMSKTLLVSSFQHRMFGREQWTSLQKRLQTLISNLKQSHENISGVNQQIESLA